jgi:hypothetical protein
LKKTKHFLTCICEWIINNCFMICNSNTWMGQTP